MSVINEALKKSGSEDPDEFGARLLRKKRRAHWGPAIAGIALLFTAGTILAPSFSLPWLHLFQNQSDDQNIKSQFAVEEASAVVLPKPDLALKGILFSQTDANDSYCIINGKIVKVGDEIEGAKLVELSAKTVTLEYNGQKIVLPVPK